MANAMRAPSRTRAAVRLGLLVVALAVLAGAAWWLADRAARRSEAGKPAASTPAAPGAAQAQSEPPPTLSERLGDALQPENAPTTEADPPQVKDGTSWGHAAGLQHTPDALRLKASAAFVIDQRTGEVLLRKNENAVLPIASLTKLMTALVLTQARLPLGEVITITDNDVDLERHSRSHLRVGTSLTRGEALHLALMSSENRAAHALARTFPGGLDAFVDAMNRKARASNDPNSDAAVVGAQPFGGEGLCGTKLATARHCHEESSVLRSCPPARDARPACAVHDADLECLRRRAKPLRRGAAGSRVSPSAP